MATKLQKKPELSVVELACARAHQVDQIEMVLQVCQDLDLAEERRELWAIEGIVDSLDGHLRHGPRVEETFGFTHVHAAKISAPQELANLEFGPVQNQSILS